MDSSAMKENSESHIVSEGGIRYVRHFQDPIAARIELMDVVEALCPKWPEREHRIDGVFLL
jgi:hypothetical protein